MTWENPYKPPRTDQFLPGNGTIPKDNPQWGAILTGGVLGYMAGQAFREAGEALFDINRYEDQYYMLPPGYYAPPPTYPPYNGATQPTVPLGQTPPQHPYPYDPNQYQYVTYENKPNAAQYIGWTVDIVKWLIPVALLAWWWFS